MTQAHMTYREALDYIHSVTWRGSRPGLKRITELLSALGHPEDELRFLHIAGTNGKGSVAAMLESVLREAGYRTGLFVSPFVHDFCERIQCAGEPIGEEGLAEATAEVREFADRMEDPPTEFELITAIGFLYFRKMKCEYVILETGMGGRLDSTNVIKTPCLSLITGIALDHTAFLGDTVEQIAAEKAGIIKPGVPVLFGNNSHSRSSADVIRRKAEEIGSPYYETDESELRDCRFSLSGTEFSFRNNRYTLPLLGTYQPRNAATVLTAVGILRETGIRIPEEAVQEGLRKVSWRARFEKLSDNPLVIYDGGHNPQGIEAALSSIRLYFPKEKILLLTGVMRDKNYVGMAKELSVVASEVFTVTPDNPRSLDARELAEVYRADSVPATPFETVQEGVRTAIGRAEETKKPLIILGSLYLYGEAYDCVKETIGKLSQAEKEKKGISR